MDYLLDIKQDWTIASNQQSTLDFPLSIPLTFYGVSFLYPGTCLISLLVFYPMLHVRAFTPILCQSIPLTAYYFHLMTRLTLQGALRKYRLFLCIAAAGVMGSTAFADTMGLVIPSKDCTWIGSIAAGPIWARDGETQTFYLAPEIEKTYAARISTNAMNSGLAPLHQRGFV